MYRKRTREREINWQLRMNFDDEENVVVLEDEVTIEVIERNMRQDEEMMFEHWINLRLNQRVFPHGSFDHIEYLNNRTFNFLLQIIVHLRSVLQTCRSAHIAHSCTTGIRVHNNNGMNGFNDLYVTMFVSGFCQVTIASLIC